MAKGGGGAGRGKSKASDPWAGWTTSVWDVRKPGGGASALTGKQKQTAARKERRNAMGGARVGGTTGFSKASSSRSGKTEMRNLQNQLVTAARAHGITGDRPIPGMGGLTPRNLSHRQFPASEGAMRAALTQLRATL